MIKSLKSNPILAHQMRNARWPSLRTAAWIAAALTVIGLAPTITAFVTVSTSNSLFNISFMICLLGWLLLDVGVLLTGIVTVVATVNAINSEAYQMISLSQLSEHHIVRGYIASALFRLRALWMVAIGLILPMAVGLAHVITMVMMSDSCIINGAITSSTCMDWVFWGTAAALVIGTLRIALFIGWTGLAAALGVWLAFRLRHSVKALSLMFLLAVITKAVQLAIPCVSLVIIVVNIALISVAYKEAVKFVRKTAE